MTTIDTRQAYKMKDALFFKVIEEILVENNLIQKGEVDERMLNMLDKFDSTSEADKQVVREVILGTRIK